MLIKSLIIFAMLLILYCLASGLYALLKAPDNSKRLLIALSWRIGLSLGLFFLLMLGFFLGIIQPHGL